MSSIEHGECSLLPPFQTFNDGALGNDFSNTPAIRYAHEFPHRYGHSSNLTAFVLGTEDDYIRGLLATSVTITAILLAWILIGLFLYWNPSFKRKWVDGYLLGRKLRPPRDRHSYSNRQEYEDEWMKWNHSRESQRRLTSGCACVGCAGIIVGAIILSGVGVTDLTESYESAIDSIRIGQDLALEGTRFFDAILESQISIASEILGLVEDAAQICPGLQDDVCDILENRSISTDYCQSLGRNSTPNSIEQTSLVFSDENSTDTNSTTDELEFGPLDAFRVLWNLRRLDLQKELTSARDDLFGIYEFAVELEDTANNYYWALQVARAFGLILAFLSCIMLAGLLLPKSKAQRVLACLRRWFLMPVFACNAILCWAFSVVFNVGATLVADICLDSPDVEFVALLRRNRDQLEPLLYDYLVFYINACPIDAPPTGLGKWSTFTVDLLANLSSTLANWSSIPKENWQNYCQIDDAPRAVDTAAALSGQICRLANLLTDLQAFLGCENFRPLYTTAAHEALCYNGTAGFLWLSISQFCIVIFSLVVFSARGAFYEKRIQDSVLEDRDVDDLLFEEEGLEEEESSRHQEHEGPEQSTELSA